MYKNLLRNTITLLLAMAILPIANAQIVDKTKDKATRKTERRIDQKIDGGIDKGLNAIEGLFKRKKTDKKSEEAERKVDSPTEQTSEAQSAEANADMQNAMMKMLMGGGEVEVQDDYHFNNRFLVNVKTYKKGDKLETDQNMTMLIDDAGGNFGMEVDNEGVSQYIIYDMKSGEMVTLISADGQKMGMTMKLDDQLMDAADAPSDDAVTFKKTGATKTISGYACEEYLVEGGDMKSTEKATVWVTDAQDADWMKAMMKMSSQNKRIQSPGGGISGSYPEGTVIQAVNEDTRSKEKSVMTVEKMEKGNFNISTKGYQFMNMGNMRGE